MLIINAESKHQFREGTPYTGELFKAQTSWVQVEHGQQSLADVVI